MVGHVAGTGNQLNISPGQPAMGVTQREGYVAAEIDHLNCILRSDARIMPSADRLDQAPLSGLKVLPSRQVFVVGIMAGLVLGGLSGYGMSRPIWDLPRIYGVAGLLLNRLVFSLAAWGIVVAFTVMLSGVSPGFGLWPCCRTAREAIREF